jgi:hypothetical protein
VIVVRHKWLLSQNSVENCGRITLGAKRPRMSSMVKTSGRRWNRPRLVSLDETTGVMGKSHSKEGDECKEMSVEWGGNGQQLEIKLNSKSREARKKTRAIQGSPGLDESKLVAKQVPSHNRVIGEKMIRKEVTQIAHQTLSGRSSLWVLLTHSLSLFPSSLFHFFSSLFLFTFSVALPSHSIPSS